MRMKGLEFEDAAVDLVAPLAQGSEAASAFVVWAGWAGGQSTAEITGNGVVFPLTFVWPAVFFGNV